MPLPLLVARGAPNSEGSSGVGSGRHIVVEACEFDRSFLQLHPKIAAILNIEADHLDCFGDMQGVVEAFGAFAAQVDGAGTLIVPARDGHALEVVGRAKARVETFGEAKEADWRAVHVEEHGGCYRFDVYYGRARLLTAELSVAGRHNVLNALAATALAFHAGAGHRPACPWGRLVCRHRPTVDLARYGSRCDDCG